MSNMTQYFYLLIGKPLGCTSKLGLLTIRPQSVTRKHFISELYKSILVNCYTFIHNFDIICVSETFLNFGIAANHPNLEIAGYNLYCADYLSNCKRGSVCIFYKARLPLTVLNISNLNEGINVEVSIAYKTSYFIHLYRSPSQTQDQFQIFRSNPEQNYDSLSSCNPSFTIVIGHFDAKSKQWCKIDKAGFEGSQLNF